MKNFTNIAFTAFVATATIGATAAFVATHNGAKAIENYGAVTAVCNAQGWLFEADHNDAVIAINDDNTFHTSGQGEEFKGTWTKIDAETIRVGDGTYDNTFDITPLCNDGSFRF
tara:strand:+ start:70 stop:411 length:342 start_codon:yes stop_codon:yes gene_type:complete